MASAALLSDAADPLMHRLLRMQKAIRREIHKAHAFVRFRRVEAEAGERYVAWFEPAHHILERIAPFFTGRFPSMHWSILTPIGSLALGWRGADARPGACRGARRRADDGLEDWWRDYYRATFNPARANPRMMRAEMPKRYWRNLPEADAHSRSAGGRGNAHGGDAGGGTDHAAKAHPQAGADARPARAGGEGARRRRQHDDRAAARGGGRAARAATSTSTRRRPCSAKGRRTRASSWSARCRATRRICRAIPSSARRDGCSTARWRKPASTARQVYVTNAVKHFKFEPRGKKRIHKTPDRSEIQACRWWLDRELAVLQAGAGGGARRHGRHVARRAVR